MLALVFSLHLVVVSFHEPKPCLSTESYLACYGKIKPARLERQICVKRDWLIRSMNKKCLIYTESSHFISHLNESIYNKYLPRFVYIYRDSCDFVRSSLARHWYQPVILRTYLARRIRRLTIQPFGNPIEDHQIHPSSEARTRFEKITWWWEEVNSNIQSPIERLPQ